MSFIQLVASLRDPCGVGPQDLVALGFSGGPDSYALLHALHAAGQPLLVAHLDHGLRPESAADAQRAAAIAAQLGSAFFTARVDVAALAKSEGLSVEEAARNARYAFLFKLAAEHGAKAVAVAHNADDQAETILMHLLRGAGAAGLRGMAPRLLPNPWSASIPLVRPLLRTSRAEVLDYCALHDLQPIMDPSNSDITYFRNRLRHELLPTLETYAPGIRRRLQHSAELLAADYELTEKLAEDAWRRCLAQRGAGFLGLQRAAFLAEPLALQRALLRRAAAELRPKQRDVDFAAIENALGAIVRPHPAPQDWLAGLCILIEGDRIWLANWEAELPVAWPQTSHLVLNLEVPTQIQLNAGWQLSLAETTADLNAARNNRDAYQTWLDAEAAGEQLTLRRPQPGDRFQPLGMQTGSQKLSDFFTNEKLPQRARAAWPLLCAGAQIAWVPGHRPAHAFRLQQGSRRALHAELVRIN